MTNRAPVLVGLCFHEQPTIKNETQQPGWFRQLLLALLRGVEGDKVERVLDALHFASVQMVVPQRSR